MIRVAKNVDAAFWISKRLHPFAKDVGSIRPEGFAAYARVFHPPGRLTPEGGQTPVRWRDIAAANNRTVAAEMQHLDNVCQPSAFSASGEQLWDQQTRTGAMPRDIVARLASILSAHTRTPELCWFAVWEGFTILAPRFREGPSFSVPERNLYLLYGALDDVLDTLSRVDWDYRPPTFWWPDDRAWCVVTEIDFTWSYVGGSQACIEQVLLDKEIEAVPTNAEEGNLMQPKEQVQEMWSRSRRTT